MKIVFYSDITNECEYLPCTVGKSIKENLPMVKDWKFTQILVNGKFLPEEYKIKDGDFVAVRVLPSSSWDDWTFGLLTGGVYNLIKMGVETYKANQELEKIKGDLKSLRTNSTKDVINIPTISGAKNQLSTGNTQAYHLGKNLYTPLIMNGAGGYRGFHTIEGLDGAKEFYNVVLNQGFNNLVFDKLLTKDICIKSFVSEKDKPTKGKFFFDSDSVFASDESFLEVAQDGYHFTEPRFINKIVEQNSGAEVQKHARENDTVKPLYFTLEKNTMATDIIILLNGLVSYNSSGVIQEASRTIIPSYSLDYAQIIAEGGNPEEATWHDFSFKVGHKDGVKQTRSTTYKLITEQFASIEEYNLFKENPKAFAMANKDRWEKVKGDDFDYSSEASFFIDYQGNVANNIYFTLQEVEWLEYHEEWEDTNTFRGIQRKQLRYNAHKDFTYDEVKNLDFPITIKISSPDLEPVNGTEYSTCYVKYIQSHTYNKIESEKISDFVAEKIIEDKEADLTCSVGVSIEATETNEDKLESIQVISSSMARIWDGAKWSDHKEITSNPAALLLEVLTSESHTPSKVSEEEIDLPSFGAWYKECSERGLFCNYVITQGMTKSAVFDLICACGRGAMYRNTFGKISIGFDGVKENASNILNEQNLISFSYEKELPIPTDGLKISYLREGDYVEDSFIVMYDGSNPATRSADSVIRPIFLEGVTTYNQAFREAMYRMKAEKLRRRTCKAEIGNEGEFFVPFSKILVQHPSLKIGLGNAEIKNLVLDESENITGLELYDTITLDTNHTFNVIIQTTDTENGKDVFKLISKQIKSYDGRTNEIEFMESIPSNGLIPKKGNVLSYGYEVEKVAEEFLISSLIPKEGGYNLELVNYDPRIIDDSEIIPDYEPNISEPIEGVPIPSISDKIESFEEAKNYTDSVTERSTIENVVSYYATGMDGTNIPENYELAPNETWTVEIPNVSAGGYLWTCNTTIYKDGHKNFSFLSARQGENGQTAGMDTLILSQYVIKKTPSGSYSPSLLEASRLHFDQNGNNVVIPAIFKLYVNGYYKETQVTTNEKLEATFDYNKYLERSETLTMLKIEMYESQAVARDIERFITQYALPVVSDGENYTFGLKNQFQQYISDTEGNVQRHTLKTSAYIFKGFDEITDWEFYDLPYDEARENGFELSVNGKEITITSLEGKTMPNSGSLRFPLFVHSTADDRRVIGNPFTKMIIGNSSKGYVFGTVVPGESTNVFSVYFSWQKTTIDKRIIANSTPKGAGVVSSITEFPSNAEYGDYVLYVGDDIGKFKKLSCYQWDGLNWVHDTNNIHVTSYLSEALEYLDENDSDSDSYKFVNNFFANRITSRKIGTQHLTLSEGGMIDCVAKDKDGNPMIMFKDTGETYLRKAIINGYPRNEEVFAEGTTEIDGGKIKANSIQAEAINVESLKATEGFFTNIYVEGFIYSRGHKLTSVNILTEENFNLFEYYLHENDHFFDQGSYISCELSVSLAFDSTPTVPGGFLDLKGNCFTIDGYHKLNFILVNGSFDPVGSNGPYPLIINAFSKASLYYENGVLKFDLYLVDVNYNNQTISLQGKGFKNNGDHDIRLLI